MPGVAPEMKAESADSAEDRHDNEHQGPDRDGKVLDVGRGRAADVAIISETGRAGETLRYRRAKQNGRDQNRLHVIRRSRFIFR